MILVFIGVYLFLCIINTIFARILEDKIAKSEYRSTAMSLYIPGLHIFTTIGYIIQLLYRLIIIKLLDWINKNKKY